jgi:hypothetical protein
MIRDLCSGSRPQQILSDVYRQEYTQRSHGVERESYPCRGWLGPVRVLALLALARLIGVAPHQSLAAIRRASSLVRSFEADRRPASSSK